MRRSQFLTHLSAWTGAALLAPEGKASGALAGPAPAPHEPAPVFSAGVSTTFRGGIPDAVRQLVVGVAENWNTHRARLMPFSRSGPGAPWQPAWPAPKPVLLGKNGLAWGNGALPVPHGEPGIPSKREKDQRAPAGLFRIGTLYGYNPAAAIPDVRLPAYQVTARDCWIDDPRHPGYNRHIVIDPANPPPWYAKQRMRLGDFAYEFLLEIRHNADPPVPGHGSAIFFHIRRGPDRASHGCTTMARADLVTLIRWLDARAHPHYVLLPREAHHRLQRPWGLPPLP